MAETVVVACKLPNGLHLDIMPDLVDGKWPVPCLRVARVTIAGNARRVGVPLPEDAAPIAAGYALTHNVPAEHWDKWLKQNEGSKLVTENLIFAHRQEGSAVAKAKENKGRRTGLERLDPDKPAPGITRADKSN